MHDDGVGGVLEELTKIVFGLAARGDVAERRDRADGTAVCPTDPHGVRIDRDPHGRSIGIAEAEDPPAGGLARSKSTHRGIIVVADSRAIGVDHDPIDLAPVAFPYLFVAKAEDACGAAIDGGDGAVFVMNDEPFVDRGDHRLVALLACVKLP